jgi:hypothetical protein
MMSVVLVVTVDVFDKLNQFESELYKVVINVKITIKHVITSHILKKE